MKLVLLRIPFVKEFWKITAAYTLSGDNSFVDGKFPLKLFYKQVLRKLILCLSLAVLILSFHLALSANGGNSSEILVGKINDHIMSMFPDLLGFGIGVYALIHILPSEHYKKAQEKFDDGKSKIQATTINSDMAYPLICLSSILLFAFLLEFFPANNFTLLFNLFLGIYGMAMIFELIYSVFLFTQKHILDISEK